jgi:hypothetical protein
MSLTVDSMSHVALARWIEIIERDGRFTRDERAHVDECDECQSLFLALARQSRDAMQHRVTSET